MNQFNQNVATVLSRLREVNYTDKNIRMYERFYKKLGAHLVQIGKNYFPALGDVYIQNLQESKRQLLYFEKSAVAKLNDVYKTGEIKGIHLSITSLGRTALLTPLWLEQVDEYLNEVSSAYSNSQLYNIKRRIIRFLKYMQQRSRNGSAGFSYDDILEFHESLSYMKDVSRTVEESSVKAFLEYLEKTGMIHFGLSLYLGVLEAGNQNIYVFHPETPMAEMKTSGIDKNNPIVSSDMLHYAITEIIELFRNKGYAEGYINILLRASNILYLFFDINGYGFNPDAAKKWIESKNVQENLGSSSCQSAKRMIDLLEMYFSGRTVNLTAAHIRGLSGFHALPEWCRIPLDAFADERIREKLDEDTVHNYIYSCTRFCSYLVSKGLGNFNEVNSDTITAFNLFDKHGSREGKNSCNHRIRKFLKFLFREGLVSQPMLYAALGTSGTVDEKNIIILSNGEIQSIRDYVVKADTPIEQRNSAMLLLGTEMGMRGCDIVNLKLRDIDWKNQSIRFTQAKTSVETILYMPAAVGNFIYRYIRNARPKQTVDDHVFLRAEAPYCGLTRNACYSALKKAVPYRSVKGSGFHATRKTFATSRLKAGVTPDGIMDAMGQRNRNSLTPYLSLDPEGMRLCSLSLQNLGLLQEGGGRV